MNFWLLPLGAVKKGCFTGKTVKQPLVQINAIAIRSSQFVIVFVDSLGS